MHVQYLQYIHTYKTLSVSNRLINRIRYYSSMSSSVFIHMCISTSIIAYLLPPLKVSYNHNQLFIATNLDFVQYYKLSPEVLPTVSVLSLHWPPPDVATVCTSVWNARALSILCIVLFLVQLLYSTNKLAGLNTIFLHRRSDIQYVPRQRRLSIIRGKTVAPWRGRTVDLSVPRL